MKRFIQIGLSVLGLAVGVTSATAHPHVWSDMRSQLIISDEGLVTGVRLQWTTDKTYARDALDGFSKDAQGNYSVEDLQKLTDENLSALSDYDYFTFFRFNGEKQKIGKAAEGQQIYNPKDGRLTLTFAVPLAAPLDPHKGAVTLKIYDPEFFIAFDYLPEKPLLISKPLPQGCTANLLPIAKEPKLEETRLMLAAKDKNWKPTDAEDFGALFAQAAEVKCAP